MREIPRTHDKVVKEARKLGYAYEYSTGGHDFYTKANPDKSLGQIAKLTIPTEIKGTKTLKNILTGMGFFEAYNVNFAGHDRTEKADPQAEARAERKREGEFVSLTREWKKAMKQFARGLLPQKPEGPPARPQQRRAPGPANTP